MRRDRALAASACGFTVALAATALAVPLSGAEAGLGSVTAGGTGGAQLASLLSAAGTGPGLAAWPTAAVSAPKAVPRASCGSHDKPETGIQGDPGTGGGFRCHLSLVGQYSGDGAALGMAWYGDCAYMSTMYSTDDPDYARLEGTVVIDASDPAHPREMGRLQTPAMVQPHESLKVNQARGLLGADQGGPIPLPNVPGFPFPAIPGAYFDLYDLRRDCAHPTLDASVELPNGSGHEGDFAPDGMTYYESTIENPPNPAIIAVDLSDPTKPHSVLQWPSPVDTKYGFHGLQIQPGGKTGWFAGQDGNDNGLVIADTSGLQARAGDLTPQVIGKVSWHDSDVTQVPQRATIAGHPYAIVTDENGATRQTAQDCQSGASPFGFLHVVDVSAPAHPAVVSTVALQIDDPANCARMSAQGGLASELAFSSHYCAVDNPDRTTAVACTWMGSGLRVFDVRDPLHPREIAYYVPPGRPDGARGGWLHAIILSNPNLDAAGSPVRWLHTRTGWELWFVSTENGLQIVRLDASVYPRTGRTATPTVTGSAGA